MKANMFILLIVISMFFVGMKLSDQNTVVRIDQVLADKFDNELQEEGSIVLDVRTPEEFTDGRIAGAININYYDSNFEKELNSLDKTASYKIYCNSGNRSGKALSLMKEMGFTNVVELSGGIQAWKSSGFPVCTNC